MDVVREVRGKGLIRLAPSPISEELLAENISVRMKLLQLNPVFDSIPINVPGAESSRQALLPLGQEYWHSLDTLKEP